MSDASIQNIFLSDANLERVCRGTNKKIVQTYLPGYIKYIRVDSASRRGTIGELLDFYNRGFSRLLYDATLALDDGLAVAIGPTGSGNYRKTPDELLDSWKFNASRQPQFREDPIAHVSDSIGPGALHINDEESPIWSEKELIEQTFGRTRPQTYSTSQVRDMQRDYEQRESFSGRPTGANIVTPNYQHVETSDANIGSIFETSAMKRMNVGVGRTMSADDPESALYVQEQIWGRADASQTALLATGVPQWGSSSGIDDETSHQMFPGVRSEVRYRDVKNHHRQYDRGNDGLGSGRELDNFSRGYDMSSLRKRKPYCKN